MKKFFALFALAVAACGGQVTVENTYNTTVVVSDGAGGGGTSTTSTTTSATTTSTSTTASAGGGAGGEGGDTASSTGGGLGGQGGSGGAGGEGGVGGSGDAGGAGGSGGTGGAGGGIGGSGGGSVVAKDCWLSVWMPERSITSIHQPFGRPYTAIATFYVRNDTQQPFTVTQYRPSLHNQLGTDGVLNLRVFEKTVVPTTYQLISNTIGLALPTGEYTDYAFDISTVVDPGAVKEFAWIGDMQTYPPGTVEGSPLQAALRPCDGLGCPLSALGVPAEHICVGQAGEDIVEHEVQVVPSATVIDAQVALDTPNGSAVPAVGQTVLSFTVTVPNDGVIRYLGTVHTVFSGAHDPLIGTSGSVALCTAGNCAPVCTFTVGQLEVGLCIVNAGFMLLLPGTTVRYEVTLDTTSMQPGDVLAPSVLWIQWHDEMSTIWTSVTNTPVAGGTLDY